MGFRISENAPCYVPKSEIRLPKWKVNYEKMDKKKLQERLKNFAIAIVRFAESLPNSPGLRTVKNQIVRSGPSSAANYRAACRAKSDADYIYKMGTVEEELDETQFWLEFTVGISEKYRAIVKPLWKEGDELLAIIVSSIVTKKKNTK